MRSRELKSSVPGGQVLILLSTQGGFDVPALRLGIVEVRLRLGGRNLFGGRLGSL